MEFSQGVQNRGKIYSLVKLISALLIIGVMPAIQESPTYGAAGDITISGNITQGSSGNLLGPGPFNRYNVTHPDGSGTSGTASDAYIRGLLADASKGLLLEASI